MSVLWAGAAEPRLQEFVALEFAHFLNGCAAIRVLLCVSPLAWDLTPHASVSSARAHMQQLEVSSQDCSEWLVPICG